MEREIRRSNEIYVILEGTDLKTMRYICLYRDLDEGLIFVKTALSQLQMRLKGESNTIIEHQRRAAGHYVRLKKTNDDVIIAQYIVQKTPIL